MRQFLHRWAYRLRGIPVENWEPHYAADRWRESEHNEWPRYVFIAAVVGMQESHETVLDLGCGTAPMREWLTPFGIRAYTGVDLSSRAIAAGRTRTRSGDLLFAADIETWRPPARYDVILFSEVLCYLEAPVATVRRYLPYLASSGVMVISNYLPWSIRRIPLRLRLRTMERALATEFPVHDRCVVRNERAGLAWRVMVLRPDTG